MKRKIFAFALCLLTVLSCVVSASATEALPRIVDKAQLLTPEEEIELEESAASFRESHDLDIVILTVDSLGGKPISTFADDYYDDNGYGVGSEYSGLILVVSMAERELYISTCGEAIQRLSDDELDSIISSTAQLLSEGEYAEAFEIFFGFTILNIDFDNHYTAEPAEEAAVNWVLSVLIGIVTAAVAVVIMRSAMNTKRPQHSAGDYLKAGTYDLYRRHDMFLYSRVSKVRRQQSSGGGHGGASVHRSSSGRSHGGHGGRF